MKLVKGLHSDNSEIDQPEGTYRDAQNMLLNKYPGTLATEEGNESIVSQIPANIRLLGDTFIYDGTIILFMTDGTDSIIAEFDSNTGSYQEILNDSRLAFDEIPDDHIIEASSRINQQGERVIYWTDDYNPPRYLNVDDVPTINNINEINIFNFVDTIPTAELDRVNNSGGSLTTGAFYFFLSYVDQDGNETNYIPIAGNIYINADTDDIEADAFDGAPAGTPTNKSIRLNLANLDTNFRSYKIAVVKKEGGVLQTPSILSENFIGTSTTDNLIYSGSETFTQGSLDEIFINQASYPTAKNLTQADDILYLGNLTEAPDVGYQKYANNIKLSVENNELEGAYGSKSNFKDPQVQFEMKSYKRDEVYAFYISLILNDGSETQAYHIPGREANSTELLPNLNTEELNIDENALNFHFFSTPDDYFNTGFWRNQDETYPSSGEDWEIWTVDSNGDGQATGDTLHDDRVRHHRMPDHDDEPIFQGSDVENVSDPSYYTLGIKLQNIRFPDEIVDQIKGFKVYYAEKTAQGNRRVVDQAIEGVCAATSSIPQFSYNEPVLVNQTLVEGNSVVSLDDNVRYFVPFHSMRTRQNIGGVSHIKRCYQPETTYESFDTNAESATYIGDYTLNYVGADIASSDKNYQLLQSAYLENNKDIVNLKSLDFEYNATTSGSESLIMSETNNTPDYPFGAVSGNSNVYNGYITELMSHQINMFNSFDQQELVWTGFIETDLSKYTDQNNFSVGTDSVEILNNGLTPADSGSIATGSMTVDSNNLIPSGNGSPASLVITVSQIPSGPVNGETFNYEFDWLDPSDTLVEHLVSGPLVKGTATQDDCVQAIADMINNSATMSNNWTATADLTNDEITVVSNTDGSQWNDYQTSAFIVYNVDTANEAAFTGIVSPSTGGQDSTAEESDYEVAIGGTTSNIVTLNGDQTLSEIATSLANTVSNSTSLDNFIATANGSTLEIQTVDNTDIYNGDSINLIYNSGDGDEVSETPGTLTGGDDPNADETSDYAIEIGGVTGVTKTISAADSLSDIADKMAASLNEATNLNTDFTASTSSLTINIETVNATPEFNGQAVELAVVSGDADINYSSLDITGGEFTETNLLFGGDTYINRVVLRNSGWYFEIGAFHQRVLQDYVVESRDNIGWRHQGDEFGEVYYPASDAETLFDLEADAPNPTDNSEEQYTSFDNYYGYNDDYSALIDLKTAIPRQKVVVDEDINHPTRIIRSQQASQDSSQDNFRVFLENDYLDLPRQRGELMKLSTSNGNILIPHMERGIFRTKGREELTTGDIRAFIGSGDIFAVEPDEMQFTDKGFGGVQDQSVPLVTPYGYFFVDRDAHKVFLVQDQLIPISEQGLRNFFEDKLNSFTTNDELHSVWDDQYDRIILTCKGDNNWTVSYYPLLEVWGSFHTYQPDYYISDLTTFYSLQNDEVYEHNISDNGGNFYGTNQPSYIDFVDNREPETTKQAVNIQFITDVVNASNEDEKFYKETFDHFRVSNNYQDSGQQDVEYFGYGTGNARHIENTWKINKFRDMVDQSTGNINLSKPWYEQGRFKDKFTRVKLIYNNSDNKFLYLYSVEVGIKQSIR